MDAPNDHANAEKALTETRENDALKLMLGCLNGITTIRKLRNRGLDENEQINAKRIKINDIFLFQTGLPNPNPAGDVAVSSYFSYQSSVFYH